MEYLLFRLYGPMASWGEIAVGEMRHSEAKPSKSALIGLLAAALGITREQEDQQQALATGYRFGIKMLSAGQVMRDYHTAQAPDSVGKFRYRTRRDELVVGRARLGTVLSTREYRTDSQAVIALCATPESTWELEKLAEALRQPHFHLYLGRKSCPLSAPLNPQIIIADGFRAALDGYQPGELLCEEQAWKSDRRWLPDDEVSPYYWEGEVSDFAVADESFTPESVQQLRRHDQPISRSRWQFQPRAEYFWMNQREVG
ncbi:MAG: type I-E CRISPR-associated protein Cas5/CasD [Candidatus Marinimicrobia bacterium]|nr:type I-E CRISPR-associated protein Cas5/CasD [Candidatus Neomarinimicrobiota bacterium]MCF7851036.1 type I-E CRISPR-associated protein Cas5/CasD [Candidatus Neomarinimicrobiota bacterium]